LGRHQTAVTLRLPLKILDAIVAPRIMHQGVTYGKGQFKILATNQAIEILGACKIHATFFYSAWN
jgi:hypothetical protein